MKRNKLFLICSIVSIVLSICVLFFYKETDGSFLKYTLYYLSSITIVLSTLLVYLILRRKKLRVFISYSEGDENVFCDLRKQLLRDRIGGSLDIAVKSSKNSDAIEQCNYAFVIISKKISGKQKYEIKRLKESKKNIAAVLAGEDVIIPEDLHPLRIIRYKSTSPS